MHTIEWYTFVGWKTIVMKLFVLVALMPCNHTYINTRASLSASPVLSHCYYRLLLLVLLSHHKYSHRCGLKSITIESKRIFIDFICQFSIKNDHSCMCTHTYTINIHAAMLYFNNRNPLVHFDYSIFIIILRYLNRIYNAMHTCSMAFIRLCLSLCASVFVCFFSFL